MTREQLAVLCKMVNDALPGAGFKVASSGESALTVMRAEVFLELAAKLLGEDAEMLRAYVALQA